MIQIENLRKVYDNKYEALKSINLEINEGELVELGSHEELVQIENGQYRHLYEMQFKKTEEGVKI